MPTEAMIQLLIQGGAVGIALALIGLVWQQNRLIRSITKDHKEAIERNSDAWVKNAEATAALKESLPHICKLKEKS